MASSGPPPPPSLPMYPGIPWPPRLNDLAPKAPGPRSSFAYSSSGGSASKVQLRSRSTASSSDDNHDDEPELDDPTWYYNDPRRDSAPQRDDASDAADETALNIGMRMLLKLGWTQGRGLGKDLQGRVEPIDPKDNSAMLGLGKARMDTRSKPAQESSKALGSQERRRINEKRDWQVAERAQKLISIRSPDSERAAHVAQVKADVAASLDKFRCDICDKAYANVSQYNEHLNSYDHHHRARAVATKQAEKERLVATGAADKRREKERKREEKELAKMMGAAGVKPSILNPTGTSDKLPVGQGSAGLAATNPVKRSGFVKVGTIAAAPSSGKTSDSDVVVPKASGFKKSGWTTRQEPSASQSSQPIVTTSKTYSAPAFRSAGAFELSKATLGTGSNPDPVAVTSGRPLNELPRPPSFDPPPPPPPPADLAPPPPPPSAENVPRPPPAAAPTFNPRSFFVQRDNRTTEQTSAPRGRGGLESAELHPALRGLGSADEQTGLAPVSAKGEDPANPSQAKSAKKRADLANWNSWKAAGKKK
ncbi:hypothetical protein OIV83_002125 [Microbotryomycetes sp. JL201]|nr:hypothetical protein OIV83_002125 [Microbotryomycetes sp. JL201]